MIPGLQGQFRLRAFHDSKGQNVPLSQNLDSKGTGQILSTQSMPQPVRVSQEGFRREESKPQGWRGRCFLENLGRVVTRQLMSIHAPTVWKAKRGEYSIRDRGYRPGSISRRKKAATQEGISRERLWNIILG